MWTILIIAVVLLVVTTVFRRRNRAAGSPAWRTIPTGILRAGSFVLFLVFAVMLVANLVDTGSSRSREASSKPTTVAPAATTPTATTPTAIASSDETGTSVPASQPAKPKPAVLKGGGGTIAPGQVPRKGALLTGVGLRLDPPGSSRGACAPKNMFLGPDGNVRLANVLRNPANNGWTRRFLHGDGGLLANRSWFAFDGRSLADVRQWIRNLREIKLQQAVSVLDTFCTAHGVMKWHAITLSPGEWVMVQVIKGEARIVARGPCVNLLLPLPKHLPRQPGHPGPNQGGGRRPPPNRSHGTPPPGGGNGTGPGPGTPPSNGGGGGTPPPGRHKPKCQGQSGPYCGSPQSGPDFQNPQKPPQTVADASKPTSGYNSGNAEQVTQQQQPGTGGDSSGNSSTPKGTDTGSSSGGSAGQTGGDNGSYSGGNSTVTNPPTPPPDNGSTSGDPCPNGPDDC
ncbi:MAG TPA: hypothetical protein VLF21_00950 [Candidatus Saccharimonadales bacterium]|nr:hypothetical protein [Candidatus Saccharimonadales bacterium]